MVNERRSCSGYPCPRHNLPALLPALSVPQRKSVPDTADVQVPRQQDNNGIADDCDRLNSRDSIGLLDHSARTGQNIIHFPSTNPRLETTASLNSAISDCPQSDKVTYPGEKVKSGEAVLSEAKDLNKNERRRI